MVMMAILLVAAPSLLIGPALATPSPRLPRDPRAPPPSAALASYAVEATGLFGNMQSTAALLAGALVPLSCFASPKPDQKDTLLTKRLKRTNIFIASASLVSELLAIVYATIAKNTLAETIIPPTASLKALLFNSDFALSWTGLNVHFLLGLHGFVATIALNVWLAFGGGAAGAVGPALFCGASSALLLMVSIVNRAIARAHASGSVVSLVGRYASLLATEAFVGRRLLVGMSLALGVAAMGLGVYSICTVEQDQAGFPRPGRAR